MAPEACSSAILGCRQHGDGQGQHKEELLREDFLACGSLVEVRLSSSAGWGQGLLKPCTVSDHAPALPASVDPEGCTECTLRACNWLSEVACLSGSRLSAAGMAPLLATALVRGP